MRYGLVIFCLIKRVLEGNIEGTEEEEEGVRSYWKTLREKDNTGNRKRKY